MTHEPIEHPGVRRLRVFIGAMLPIAVAYLAIFVAGAIAWHNAALAVGSIAIVVYLVALIVARALLRRPARAALITGSGLLAMIAIAAFEVHFQTAAFPLIAIAAVVVVIPHLERRALMWFALAALAISVLVVVLGVLEPAFTQPPAWFATLVRVSSIFAASCLVIVMLAADHQHMRTLVRDSDDSASAARRARAATEGFLVFAAHQFRTPVSTLLLQSESLLEQQGTGAGRGRIERLVRASKRLRVLVDAMLDVSRITSGTLSLERRSVDMAALVRDVVALHASLSKDAGVELACEIVETAEVEGDPRRLELVVAQLIENALRLGPGQPARIEVRRDGADVVVAITDGGDGLDAAQRARIFDREATLTSDHDGGPGLGLWLVFELSRAMGGSVSVRPGATRGTCFELRLPGRSA